MLIISIHLLSRIPEHISPLHCLASTLWVILTKNTTSLICTASLSTKSTAMYQLPVTIQDTVSLIYSKSETKTIPKSKIYFLLSQDM